MCVAGYWGNITFSSYKKKKEFLQAPVFSGSYSFLVAFDVKHHKFLDFILLSTSVPYMLSLFVQCLLTCLFFFLFPYVFSHMCAVVGFLKQKKADPTMKMKKISAAAAGRVGH
jgi:hypothetical protein